MMNKHEHIKQLVKKLLDDNLSSNELHELQRFFRSTKVQGEAKLWLDELWKDSELQKSYPVDSQQILNLLNNKIHQQQKRLAPVKLDHEWFSQKLRSMMRYAAVFVMALALSWFWRFRDELPAEEKSATEPATATGSNEISVTYGSKTRIILPDSSIVYLNSGSQLSYPSVFSDDRHVTLTGEGYFVVRSDSLHPFMVHTHDVSVKALGTEFNVKAYPEEQRVETTLVKGVVEILKKDQTNPITELKPGEKATFVKSAPVEQPQQQIAIPEKGYPQMVVGVEKKPDVSTGWVKNQLVFDAEPFEEIAVKLERWFNVEIDIRNQTLKKARLSGRYDTENIEQVMHSLQIATSFTYKTEKNKIIIR